MNLINNNNNTLNQNIRIMNIHADSSSALTVSTTLLDSSTNLPSFDLNTFSYSPSSLLIASPLSPTTPKSLS